MKSSPCIENKCLKYPVCKSKEVIWCSEMLKYYHYLTRFPKIHDVKWEILISILPKMLAIKNDRGVYEDEV